jgi:hypothetical protein
MSEKVGSTFPDILNAGKLYSSTLAEIIRISQFPKIAPLVLLGNASARESDVYDETRGAYTAILIQGRQVS